MSRPVNPADIRRSAMDLLSRREHSVEELVTKLKRRFGNEPNTVALIVEQLERLTAQGLQSDERYAASMLRQQISKGLGPRRLDQELRAKGVRDEWQNCAEADQLDVDWFERAREVYLKKFGVSPLPQDSKLRQKEWARRARFMQYRGFEPDHFMSLLNGEFEQDL
ncbi:MAG: hypothetical protein RLZZ602_1129 [Pseudomonadota bacterium]|jgi:regulatory protein